VTDPISTAQPVLIDYANEDQLLRSLEEKVVTDWYQEKILTSGPVAERLIRERQGAADCIRKLRAELDQHKQPM
jgi:hypothetical protein